jgi:integrase
MLDILQQHRRDTAARALKVGRTMPDTVFVNDAGGPMDASKVRRAHDRGLKAAGLRHIRLHDTRGTFSALTVSAGVPVYHVSKSLGHSSTEVTERHYADLAPGAAKELPNVLERYVFGNKTERDANGMRTEDILEKKAVPGETVSA